MVLYPAVDAALQLCLSHAHFGLAGIKMKCSIRGGLLTLGLLGIRLESM